MTKADKILVNGKVYSVLADNSILRGTAVAISDGRILKVGNDEEVKAFASEATEVIDCGGNTILPGMCDAHCHPSIACASLAGANLFGVYKEEGQSEEDVIEIYKQMLKEYVDANPDKPFIRGTGWVKGNFSENRWPNRHDLDEICPDKPVVLESFCQHNLWCNTKALELGGIDENTPDVETGKIVREADNYPGGAFLDAAAVTLVKSSVPGYELSKDEIKELFENYQNNYASRYGVTMVTDCMLSDASIEAYKELAEEGKLNLRMRTVRLLTPEDYAQQMPRFIAERDKYSINDLFRIDTVKIFAEGEPVMLEPYRDEYCEAAGLPKGYNGKYFWTDEVLTEYSAKAMEAGYSVHIHAMGDGTISQSAKCLAAAQEKAGLDNTRSVICHLMLVPDEIAELMGKANIIANVQPRWMVREDDVQYFVDAVGELGEESYPFRKFVDAGCVWAAGTDFPVTIPPSTMEEMHVWMNRTCFPDSPEWDEWQGHVLGTEEPATLAEAVKGLTWGGAYQMRMEDYAGTIEEGKSADFVILNGDLEGTPKEEIYKLDIAKTIFKGKVVYEA